MHTYTPANSIFDEPFFFKNLLSVLCIFVEVLSCTHVKRGESLNDFKFGTSAGHCSSDGSERVKITIQLYCPCVEKFA